MARLTLGVTAIGVGVSPATGAAVHRAGVRATGAGIVLAVGLALLIDQLSLVRTNGELMQRVRDGLSALLRLPRTSP